MSDSDDPMPSPPFPDPNSELLRVAVEATIEQYRRGDCSAEETILPAAVTGWCEGHIEGEEVCPGCSYRGTGGIPRPGVADLN